PTATSGGSVTARKAAISHTRSSRHRDLRGGSHEPDEERAKVRQEHHRDQQEGRRTHGRGTSRDEGARQRAEGDRDQGGGRKRRAREDRRNGGLGSGYGQAGPRDRQSQRARPLPEALVRDARVLQGRQGRLLLPRRAEVQEQVRDVRLQRRGEPRRGRPVAGRLRAEGADCGRGGTHRRAGEESGELIGSDYRGGGRLARRRAASNCALGMYTVAPPSTISVAPLTYAASSDARNSTALATSCGSQSLGIG